MVGNRVHIPPKEIGIDVEGPRHFRSGVQYYLRLAVLEIDIARENGLAILDHIDVRRAASSRGQYLQLTPRARLDDPTISTQQNLVSARAGLDRNTAGHTITAMIVSIDLQ